MSKRILVVDDDPSVVEVLDLLLTSEGYEVMKAGDGQEGLELTQRFRPDGIILDVKMPKMSGYMMAKLLDQEELLRHIPILLLTATPTMAGSITLESPTPYRMSKPFKPDELLSTLRKMLEKKTPA